MAFVVVVGFSVPDGDEDESIEVCVCESVDV